MEEMNSQNQKTHNQSPSMGTGVFINGRAQAIEILQLLSPGERKKLLKNMRVKNPQLADELVEKSFTFSELDQLRDHDLKVIFDYIKAPILGMALKFSNRNFQRRMLSLAERGYAENAYEAMMASYKNEKEMAKKAQNKVVSLLVSLSKKKQINL